MITQRELETRLQSDAQDLNRDFPTADRLELMIMARVAATPREERRRALTLKQELAVAGLFVVVAALLVIGIGRLRAITQPVPARPTPSVKATSPVVGGAACGYFEPRFLNGVEPVKMLSPAVGWAKGGLRTTDGGAHWRDVSPPTLRQDAPTDLEKRTGNPPGYLEFYLDGNHAWESRDIASTTPCNPDGFIVFGTANGGRTWYQSEPVRIAGPLDRPHTQSLFFSDPMHGWLLVDTRPTATASGGTRLYRTTDGGRRWKLIADLLKVAPVQEAADTSGIPPANRCTSWFGDLSFASQSTGWISIPCGSAEPELFATRDGGATWSLLQLQSPGVKWVCHCYASPPIFFDRSRGVIQGSDSNGTQLAATSDGGQTWQALPAPPTGYASWIDLADASNFWELVIPEGSWNKACSPGGAAVRSLCPGAAGSPHDWLYHSSDGGSSWKLVQKNLPIGLVNTLLFIDGDHGIVTQPLNGVNGVGPQPTPEELLTTLDGGHTWKSIEPQGLPS